VDTKSISIFSKYFSLEVIFMKKHIIRIILLATAVASQTGFGMNAQASGALISSQTVPVTTGQVAATQEAKPSFKARLLAKATQAKNWTLAKTISAKNWAVMKAAAIKEWTKTHKKPLLIGTSIVLILVAAYLGSYLMHSGTQVSGDETYQKLLHDATSCVSQIVAKGKNTPQSAAIEVADACSKNLYNYVAKNQPHLLYELPAYKRGWVNQLCWD
jgi:hypothetical protein